LYSGPIKVLTNTSSTFNGGPDTIVKLYSGPIKVLTNTSSTFNGGLAIVEGRDMNQVAGLELTETFLLCGRAAQKTHIRNIVVFFHPMSQIQVASGKFDAATTEASITRLESELSFLQVKATMTLQERIRQVKGDICENRRQIAQLRLESIAGAENPYSLIQIFKRGHQVTRNGATVYVTRCQPVEVTPRMHVNCTSEIPVTVNNTNLFVDPISFVIKAAASPVRCNDIAPPRWKLGGKWYCAFPQIRDCGEPGQIPMTQDARRAGAGDRARQEYLQSGANRRVHPLLGEPRHAQRVSGRKCGASIQQQIRGRMGIRTD
jgi:hypothetical protein